MKEIIEKEGGRWGVTKKNATFPLIKTMLLKMATDLYLVVTHDVRMVSLAKPFFLRSFFPFWTKKGEPN